MRRAVIDEINELSVISAQRVKAYSVLQLDFLIRETDQLALHQVQLLQNSGLRCS